jgi:hypothetical protein
MSKKLETPLEHLRLSLVDTHREHCPWKNPDTQRNPLDGPIANMAGWQTQLFMMTGSKRRGEKAHNKNIQSVDLGSEYAYRASMDSETENNPLKEGEDKEESRWRKLKAKLKRTASKKSLRSVKSAKSVKSLGEKDRENETTG